MKVYTISQDIIKVIEGFKAGDKNIGFVPTMGALHRGHLALVEEALLANDFVVVSIFVNPTQFDNQDDLHNYPQTLDQDLTLLKSVSTNRIIVFAPTVKTLYQKQTKSDHFDFDGLDLEMEGKFRIGHFDGVGTIVKKLLHIIEPDRAYFGEKDFQQLQIIKKLVEKHLITTEIIGCKIYRETSGLAMSSRNERLEEPYKKEAPFIYKILKAAKVKFGTDNAASVTQWVINEFKNNEFLQLEYFTISDEQTLKPITKKLKNNKYRAFIAVYAGKLRLIDNIALN